MLICPTCRTSFAGEEQFCPLDGSPLGKHASTEPGRDDDPFVGRVLSGRYRLLERLGQGGMGTVYRGTHTLMDKPVAVKILRSELSTDAEAITRFHREARSASRLDHDHCIRVSDFGQSDDGLLFLVMELLDGDSLSAVTKKGPVPAARAAAIGVAIAEALQHAHEQGVIHRDLKPDNVLLARRAKGREMVKVLDFGLAKLASDSALGPSITRDGTVFGTPEYMAPEQAEGQPLDGRTDIYALGVILYQLLVGGVPFSSDNFVALLTKQVSEQPLPPRQRRPDLEIPEALEAVVMRCLEKSRDARHASAAELADALYPFAAADPSQKILLPTRDLGHSGAMALPDDPDAAGAAPSRVWRTLLVFGSVAFVAAAVGFVFVGLSRRHRVEPAKVVASEPALQRGKRLLAEGDLDGADHILRDERAASDSAELQELMSEVSEQLGNRLGALAHLHRAIHLAPEDAEPRARLAALLLRLGQPRQACLQAQKALALDAGPRASSARSVVAHAKCGRAELEAKRELKSDAVPRRMPPKEETK